MRKQLFIWICLALLLSGCNKEPEPEPAHPQKAELQGSWLPGGYAVFTLYHKGDTAVFETSETHVYEHYFHGDSVTTWFDTWHTTTRKIEYPLYLPDGMEHSHVNSDHSKSRFEVVRLTDDTLQLRAVYDYQKVYQFLGHIYNTHRSELAVTYVR